VVNPDLAPRLFIQLPEVWGPRHPESEYREGFQEYVTRFGRPLIDQVILIEPNASRVEALQHLWSDWRYVRILNCEIAQESQSSIPYFWVDQDLPLLEFSAPSAWPSLQRYPSARIQEKELPSLAIASAIPTEDQNSQIAMISVDLRRTSLDGELIDWSALATFLEVSQIMQLPHALHFTTSGLTAIEVTSITPRLRTLGFRQAGRAWGAADTGVEFIRPQSLSDQGRQLLGRLKVAAGRSFVRTRDSMLTRQRRTAVGLRLRASLPGSLAASHFIDDDLARPLAPPPIAKLHHVCPPGDVMEGRMWNIEIVEPDPTQIAQECFAHHGIWPISFSYPKGPLPIKTEPEWLIAPITPGLPYTFTHETEYLQTYQRAFLGLTHRKAGWDCFRHLEILASGAIPLMPDAGQIPRYAMIHHPKRSFAEVSRIVKATGAAPSIMTRNAFRDSFHQRLTSQVMAAYLLTMSGLQEASKILFVDERLPHHNDYQSVLTLIGLKQLLGADCHVLFPTDYLYEDTTYPIETLYGRGFGYTKVLPRTALSSSESRSVPDILDFDAVVVGSISRNWSLAQRLLTQFPKARTIWIHGEDTPPMPKDLLQMRQAGTHLFVRAIHTGR
jgi:hypothetical protein